MHIHLVWRERNDWPIVDIHFRVVIFAVFVSLRESLSLSLSIYKTVIGVSHGGIETVREKERERDQSIQQRQIKRNRTLNLQTHFHSYIFFFLFLIYTYCSIRLALYLVICIHQILILYCLSVCETFSRDDDTFINSTAVAAVQTYFSLRVTCHSSCVIYQLYI